MNDETKTLLRPPPVLERPRFISLAIGAAGTVLMIAAVVRFWPT